MILLFEIWLGGRKFLLWDSQPRIPVDPGFQQSLLQNSNFRRSQQLLPAFKLISWLSSFLSGRHQRLINCEISFDWFSLPVECQIHTSSQKRAKNTHKLCDNMKTRSDWNRQKHNIRAMDNSFTGSLLIGNYL